MTDRGEHIRNAFQDDSLTVSDRDRLWSTMQHRQTRQARLRNLVRAGALLLAVAAFAAYAILRSVPNRKLAGVVAAVDSLTTISPSELSVIQENPQEAVASNLIPLLGHRSSLRIDIANAETRRDELLKRLEQTTGREHDRVEQELASVEQQIEASRVAISVIDRQLTGHEPAVVHTGFPVDQQVIQWGPPPVADELLYTIGGAGGLLLLGMLSVLIYMRRIARSTREALSLIEGQVSSQHATLASGIDAIALEVERLGEGQRFMSKALASDAKVRLPE